MHISKLHRVDAAVRPLLTVSLEREGEAWLDRITGAVRAEPWPITLLKLAWTAGPATFIAASLGYYLGYGRLAPLENLRFFFAYTVITGLIGLTAGIFARATYGERLKVAKDNLLEVADRLPDLIAAVRDLRLSALEPEIRRLEAAGVLLQRVDLDPMALKPVVIELGAGAELAEAACRIEIYRLAGLYSRMDELVAEYAEQAEPVIAALSEWTPRVAMLLRARLNGHAPSFNSGIPRDHNFIERTLAAMEHEDEQLMTLIDAEEMLVLACELIHSRSIPMLIFTYRGRWDLVQATELLERRRNLYRISNSKVLSRLKALVALLGESDNSDVDSGVRGLEGRELLARVRYGITELNRTIVTLVAEGQTERPEIRVNLRKALQTLQSALKLIDIMRRAARHAARRHTLFLRTTERWGRTLERHGALEMGAPYPKQPGLRVVERRIGLADEQCLELASRLVELLKNWGIMSRGDRLFYRHGDHHRPLTIPVAKGIAMEVATALQPFVDITRPEVQRAIDASPATNLLGLESTLSARTKAAWGAAAVQEVEDDLGQAAERLAATLVTSYRIEMSAEAMEFLHQTYGARLERLQLLNTQGPDRTLTTASATQARPPLILPQDPAWREMLECGRRLLRQHERLLG